MAKFMGMRNRDNRAIILRELPRGKEAGDILAIAV